MTETEERKRSAITYSRVCSQLNEEPFAFEAEFANLGPVESVNFCVPLNKGHDEELINIREKTSCYKRKVKKGAQ